MIAKDLLILTGLEWNKDSMMMSKYLLLIFVLVTFSHFSCISQSKSNVNQQNEWQFIFHPQSKHVHSSSIVELSNEDLLCCWFEGTGERTANDVVIKGARLQKGVETWSKPFVMADTPNNPDCNPILFLDNKNRLHLIWIVVVANKWEASVLKTRISKDYLGEGAPNWEWQDIILLKPGKEFTTTIENKFKEMDSPELAWAEYAPLYEKMIHEASKEALKRETGWMTRIKPLILENGKIILPLYSDGFNLSLIAVSDDDGDTWSPSLPIVGRGNIQPAILQKNNGTLVAYMRDNGDAPGKVFKSTSKDNGYSWDFASKTNIPNPGSSIDAITLADGRWLMVCNDIEKGRGRLSVMLSEDEGETWKWRKSIENNPDGKFSYPSIIQTKDGLVHISYSYHIKKEKTIKHICFPVSWINEGGR